MKLRIGAKNVYKGCSYIMVIVFVLMESLVRTRISSVDNAMLRTAKCVILTTLINAFFAKKIIVKLVTYVLIALYAM